MKNKEQFNLALWDRLKKDNIPHEFETRNGSVITQLKVFYRAKDQQIIGYNNIDDSIERWTINGVYYNDTTKDSDLFIVWEEEENENVFKAYMAIMKYDGLAMTFPTLKIAQVTVGKNAIAIIPVSIPYTKGEGLDGK